LQSTHFRDRNKNAIDLELLESMVWVVEEIARSSYYEEQ
jgi:hypothetical protein